MDGGADSGLRALHREPIPGAPRKFNQAKQHFCPVAPAKKRTAVRSRTANCGRPGWQASQPFPDVGLASHQLQTRMKSRYRASEERVRVRESGRIFIRYPIKIPPSSALPPFPTAEKRGIAFGGH